MKVLRTVDPVDSMSRKQHRLQRRAYYNKVKVIMYIIDYCDIMCYFYVGPKLCLAH